jgi:hypothetical protein
LQLRRERVQFHVASTTQKNTAYGGAFFVENMVNDGNFATGEYS